MECTGNGLCFYQVDQGYDQNECKFSCKLVDCPNKPLCGKSHPAWYLGCHQGRCANCNMILGRDLSFCTGECPACSLRSTLALLRCGDKICCDCLCEALKWNYDIEPDYDWDEYIAFLKGGEPSVGIKNLFQCLLFQMQEPSLPFPDPALEDEWSASWDHPKWRADPLISAWLKIDHRLDKMWQALDELKTSKCPVCKSLVS